MSIPLHFLMRFKKVKGLSQALEDHVRANKRLEEEISALRIYSRSLEAKLNDQKSTCPPINFEYAYNPTSRKWHHTKAIQRLTKLLSAGSAEYEKWLDALLIYRPHFETISLEEPTDPQKPYWLNDSIPPLDTMSLYAMLAKRIPRKYIEVGSGHSTKFARQAIIDHSRQPTNNAPRLRCLPAHVIAARRTGRAPCC
jgi:hypothetical protein